MADIIQSRILSRGTGCSSAEATKRATRLLRQNRTTHTERELTRQADALLAGLVPTAKQAETAVVPTVETDRFALRREAQTWKPRREY